MRLGYIIAVGILWKTHSVALAFTFSAGAVSQCDNLNINWTGGQPPFQLLVIPPGGTTRNFTIPASSFTNNQGSFSTQLNLPQGQKVLLSMSDATGFATGGTTDILTVGSSISGQSCNTTDPGVAFFFNLDSDLNQCQPYPITAYVGAIQPITILVYIPNGNSFALYPPSGPTSFNWTVTEPAGTSIVFSMFDSQGRQGGSASVRVVLLTNDSSCLNNSTSSTASSQAIPAATSTMTSNPTASNPTKGISNSSSTKRPSVGDFVAIGAGAFVVVTLLIILGVYCFRKQRRQSPYYESRKGPVYDLDYDPVAGNSAPAPISVSHHYEPTPFVAPTNPPYGSLSTPYDPPPVSRNSSHIPDTSYPPHETTYDTPNPREYSYASSTPSGSSGSNPRYSSKPSSASTSNPASRFIVHTDVEEVMPPNEHGVIELPPQYSERRAPVSGFPSSSAGSSSTRKAGY